MPNSILNDTNKTGLNVYLQSDNASVSKGDADKIFFLIQVLIHLLFLLLVVLIKLHLHLKTIMLHK